MSVDMSDDTEHAEARTEVVLAREILEAIMSRTYSHLNNPFMDEVDSEELGLKDYKLIITEPMWLRKMSQKFADGVYHNIREFVCDFRLMLLNCYRYNGTSSRMGRFAEKLELLFEQKLQLLSTEIRAKTSIQSTLGCTSVEDEMVDCDLPRRRSSSRLFLSGDSRQLTPIRSIMEELEHAPQPGGGVTASLVANGNDLSKYTNGGSFSGCNSNQSVITSMNTEDRVAFLVARLSLWRRRRHEEALLESWNEWWLGRDGPAMKPILNHTPELLEAYQFLWLADPFLGISDYLTAANNGSTELGNRLSNSSRGLCLFDLEIGLSTAPRECRVLAACMTTLLATPRERAHLISALGTSSNAANSNIEDLEGHSSIPSGRRSRTGMGASSALTLLDYEVWERRLSARVESWYRSFIDKGKGIPLWATRRLGLVEYFFSVCGSKSNPLETKRYHELPLLQRIQLLHALCETTLRNFENLRSSLDKCADWDASRPVKLGIDKFSNHIYIHFPELLDSEPSTMLRVYRIIHTKPDFMDDFLVQKPDEIQDHSNKDVIQKEPPLEVTTTNTNSDSHPEKCDLTDSEDIGDSSEPQKKPGRSRKRKLNKKQNPKITKNEDDLAKHDILLSETGIYVPGPVQRLPNWIHPSLARHVYRRWCELSERLFIESQQPDNAGSKLDKQNRKKFSNNPALFLNHMFHTNSSRGRKKNLHTTPFANFEGHDVQLVQEMMKEEPALNPSVYATLIGPSRRFLSMQLSRNYSGPLRVGHKPNSRRGIVSQDSTPNLDSDQISTDHQVDDLASSTPSQFESDEEDNRTIEAGDDMHQDEDDRLTMKENSVDSKRISFTIGSASEDGDALADADEAVGNADDKQSPNTSGFEDGLFSRMQELIKRTTPPEKRSQDSNLRITESSKTSLELTSSEVIQPSAPKEEPLKLDSSAEESKPEVPESPTESPLPAVKTREEVSIDSVKKEPVENQEETDQKEVLIAEPDSQKFALVASNIPELDTLLGHLNQILEEKQTKLSQLNNDPNCMLDEFDLDLKTDEESEESFISQPKRRKLSVRLENNEGNSAGQLQLKRFEKALTSLSNLIDNLENLRKNFVNRDSERTEAQKLACLRLRKDVESWEQKEAEKKKEAEVKATIPTKLSILSNTTSSSIDTSKNRAERHLRREQRKEQDHFDEQISEVEKISQIPERTKDKGADISDKPNRLSSPTIPIWRSSISGNPKVPISRLTDVGRVSLSESTPKIRRTAFIDPTKTSPSVSKLSQFRSIYPNSNRPMEPRRFTLGSPTPYTIRFPQAIRPNVQRSMVNCHPNGIPIPRIGTPSSTIASTAVTSSNNHPQPSNPQSPTSTNPVPAIRPNLPVRKIYRVYDTLFTEDARPVKIGPNGSLMPLPLDSVPISHQQLARQMISKYHQSIEPKINPTNPPADAIQPSSA